MKLDKLYAIKRTFTFLDEWLFYCVLIYMYKTNMPIYIPIITGVYGIMATTTSYLNLTDIEEKMGVKHSWMLWPFFRCKTEQVLN